jgi:hypothetical protein
MFCINLEEQSGAEDEPAMVLASFAMVVAPEQMEVDSVSLASIFNSDFFQSQESVLKHSGGK